MHGSAVEAKKAVESRARVCNARVTDGRTGDRREPTRSSDGCTGNDFEIGKKIARNVAKSAQNIREIRISTNQIKRKTRWMEANAREKGREERC